MPSTALCSMKLHLSVKTRYFIRDFYEHSVARHSDTFVVYRSQGLIQTHFAKLSMGENRQMSLVFAHWTIMTPIS